MTKKIAPALLAGLLTGILAFPAQAQEEEGWWYGGSFLLTSDYVFRGVSQTDEGPAAQGSLDFGHASGFYAGAWASNVDFDAPDGIDMEINLYAGWVFGFENDSELDLQLVRYLYPGSNPGFGINYNELIAAYSYLDFYTATIAYSDDYLNTDESAFYYQFGAEFPLAESDYTVAFAAGYNDISSAAGSDYWDFQLGISRSWRDFNVDLSYFDTSGYDSEVRDFLGPKSWADGRFVLSVGMEF